MEKKTHIAFSNAICLGILRPTTITGIVTVVAAASLGGVISDVDLKNSDIDKLFDKIMIAVCSSLLTCVLLDKLFNLDLYNYVRNMDSVFRYIVSTVIFVVISYFASTTPHRSFTHSILGVCFYAFIVHLGFSNSILIPFTLGMITHIFIDFFNMTGLQLFYPFKPRLCLNLCDSHGFINKLLFELSSLVTIIIFIILVLQTF